MQGLADVLARADLIGPAETPCLEPLTGGVSADVFVLRPHVGPPVVVKRSIGRLRVAEEWLAPTTRSVTEARWLEFARTVDPRLAPRVLAEMPDAHVFVMELLDPATHPVWKAELAAGRVDPAFAGAVGADLARLHAAGVGRADLARTFGDPTYFFDLRISPFLLRAADHHPDVAARLGELAADLAERRTTVVHGDVSPKNILVGPAGPVFIDAETCVFGDPAFDFAFCLSHLLLKTVWLPPWRAPLEASFDAFARAYLAGVGWEDAPALARRAAALTAALLLARIDGKSPAPYITADDDKAFVRRAAKALLADRTLTLDALAAGWRAAQAAGRS